LNVENLEGNQIRRGGSGESTKRESERPGGPDEILTTATERRNPCGERPCWEVSTWEDSIRNDVESFGGGSGRRETATDREALGDWPRNG